MTIPVRCGIVRYNEKTREYMMDSVTNDFYAGVIFGVGVTVLSYFIAINFTLF